jgi:hypothetical protein
MEGNMSLGWEHPMSRDEDTPEPKNLTSGGYTFGYKVYKDEVQVGYVTIAVADPCDEDLVNECIIEALEKAELVDMALDEYFVRWRSPRHGSVHYAPAIQNGTSKVYEITEVCPCKECQP